MKKFFNTIALLTLLFGASTTASAQHFGYPHHGNTTVIIDRHYDYHDPYYHHHEPHYERHSNAAAAGLLVGALVGGAIVAAAESSAHATPAPAPAQPRYDNTYYTSYNTGLQHYVNNGISYDSNEPHARITNVVKTPNSTTVYFEYFRNDKDYRIRLNQGIYLSDRSNNQRLYPISCRGIAMGNWTNTECGYTHEFSVTFPAIAANCHNVDLVEPNTDGWKFYHVNF